MEDVDAVLSATVSEDGRLWGLKEYAGRRVYVVIPEASSEEPAAADLPRTEPPA